MQSCAVVFAARGAGAGSKRAARTGRRKTLITIFQRGAVDGLNMVVPHGESAYYDAAPDASPSRSRRAERRARRRLIWTASSACIRRSRRSSRCGMRSVWRSSTPSARPTTRARTSTRRTTWSRARPGVKSTHDGWLNRYLQAKPDAKASPFRAVSMTQNMPRALQGRAPALAMSNLADFTIRAGAYSQSVQGGFEAIYDQSVNDVLQRHGQRDVRGHQLSEEGQPGAVQA